MRSILLLPLALAAGCAHDPVRFVPRTEAVEVEDQASELVRGLEAAPDDRSAGEAWVTYLRRHPELDDGDLSSVRPEALGKAGRLALPQLRAATEPFAREAQEVVRAVSTLFGRSQPGRVVLAVRRDDLPVATQPGSPPRVVINARSPATSDPLHRQALMAHALALAWLEPPSSLGPLASTLYLNTLASAAAQGAVPGAPRAVVTQRSVEDIKKLDARLALTAREALAALDSAAPAQAERFFGAPATPDPLVPPGAGPHLAVELAAALAESLGSPQRALRLTAGEFRREAAQALQRMARTP